MSELSERTGVPVPTIKYYLREGLLPEGEKRTPRLTDYGEQHVRRLELLRILRDAGDVPVEGLKRLVAATETQGTVHDLFAVAADALAPTPPPASADPSRAQAREIADAIIDQAGWDRVRTGLGRPRQPRGDPGAGGVLRHPSRAAPARSLPTSRWPTSSRATRSPTSTTARTASACSRR